MPKRTVLSSGLMVVWLGLNQSAVLACPCWDKLTPSENLNVAGAVFAGRLISSKEEVWRNNRLRFDRRPPFIHLTEDGDWYRSTFEVTKVWKGDVTVKTSVFHPISGCASYSFRREEEYIVYASWFKDELHTAGVYRNTLLSEAGEDLLAFGAGKPPLPNPSSLSDLSRRLTVLSLLLGLFGWAIWQARRKYGVQKS
jgi:hypothetical protein